MVVVHPFIRLPVCHGCIVAKSCKIGLRLLLITNWFRWKSLTLDDLQGRYVHFPMENWPYLGNSERYDLVYY